MKSIHILLLFLLSTFLTNTVMSQHDFRQDFYSTLKGKWKGIYETLDYDDDSTKYVMETGLNCDTIPGMVMFTLSFQEPDGSNFFDSGDIVLTDNMSMLFFDGEWNVESYSSEPGDLRLVATQEGMDGSREAAMRQSFHIRDGNSLSIVKEVKYLDGEGSEYFVRNKYELARQ